MKSRYIFFLMLGMLLFSCTKQESNLTILQIKGFQDTTHIQGRYTGISDPYFNSFKIIDSIAVFSIYPHPQYGFRVYNLNTLKHMGDIVHRGKGPKEFLNPLFIPQPPVCTNGEIKVWITDFPQKTALINITQSLNTGKTVVEKEYNFARPGKPNLLYQANNLSYSIGNDIFLMPLSPESSINSDNPNPEPMYIVYDYAKDQYIDTLRYKYDFLTCSYMDPTTSKIVNASSLEDLISIYDFKAKHETILYHSHTIKKPEELNKFGSSRKMGKLPDYAYYGCQIHNNLIFCTYDKNSQAFYLNPESPDGNYHIHIFDLDGRPLHSLVLKESIFSSNVDERKSILYVLNSEKDLYAYSLQEILKKSRNTKRK